MKAIRILLLLPLLVAAKAFPQKVVSHEIYNVVVDDTLSKFHNYYGYELVGKTNALEGGDLAFPFCRITTSNGDTIVCFVTVGVSSNKRAHVWAEIKAEGQCRYDIASFGKFSGWYGARAERHKKVKWHERIKVSVYMPYSRIIPGRKKPFTRRVTAYIDYFPFYPWQSMVRFKVKDIKQRMGCKYNISTLEQIKECSKKTAANNAKIKRQFEFDREKGRKWEKKYAKKYRPDLLHYYKKQESKK